MKRHFLLLFAILITLSVTAQYTSLASIPASVSNNAVVAAEVGGKKYVYSFCGIDSTKIWSGIHLKAWRYDVTEDEWMQLPDVPDPNGGKIAASASLVKNKIYLIGGYHVAQSGSETSSNKVHVFDPENNDWLPDGAPIPVAIDDQVQAVWKDSLIYVVTGWSNTTNVVNVQVFNPTDNTWTPGTPVPNQSDYRVFGGSGEIIEDTIYYAGGAKSGFNFPASTVLRKGAINPENPSEINWTKESNPNTKGYRMAATTFEEKVYWLGGSDITYNYNGIAYNGSGGVPSLDRITIYDPMTGKLEQSFGNMPAIMDLRGVGKISDNEIIIAGGMKTGQQVTNETWLINLDEITSIESIREVSEWVSIYPNPVNDKLYLTGAGWINVELASVSGQIVVQKTGFNKLELDLIDVKPGVYFLFQKSGNNNMKVEKIIIQH